MLDYIGHHRPPLDAVRALLAGNDAVFAAVAYVKRAGVELLRRDVQRLTKRQGTLAVLTTFDFNTTDPDALDQLVDLGADVRIFSGRTYHPKVFLGARGTQRHALIGSANLTGSGLLRNVEAGLHLTGKEALPIHAAAHQHLHPLWQRAAPYQRGTIRAIPPPVLLTAQPTTPVEHAWAQLLPLRGQTVHTASGQPNRVLAVDPAQGVLIGTERSPNGKWVTPWMIEVVVTWLEAHQTLRLNTAAGSGIPDCTRYLAVHRSSAVFALLGALPGYRLSRKPATLSRV